MLFTKLVFLFNAYFIILITIFTFFLQKFVKSFMFRPRKIFQLIIFINFVMIFLIDSSFLLNKFKLKFKNSLLNLIY